SDSASASGGTATAASVNLQVGTSGGTSASYPLSTLTTGTTLVVPGNTVQAPLTVKNSGTDPLQWRMQATTPLTDFTLTTYGVANEGACPVGVNTAAPAVAPLISGSMNASLQYPVSPAFMPPLASNATYVLCLRLTVGTESASGATNTTALTFQAGPV
ncbi:hypothetical protein QM646_21310, partial [Rhodococcus erythropolis]|nr:hypothetical protein [Rhodococcus erythropolis]